jgi:tRNA U55 pseudouridine synthase TruB
VRTAIGRFSLSDAVALDDLDSETLLRQMQSPLAAIPDLSRVELTNDQIEEVRNGRSIPMPNSENFNPSVSKSTEFAAVNGAGRLVGILFEKRPSELWPAMNFL